MNIRVKKSLQLLVDMQTEFVNDDNRHIPKPINSLIQHWRDEYAPIIFSRLNR